MSARLLLLLCASLALGTGVSTAQTLPPSVADVPVGVAGYIGETEKGVFDTPTRVTSFLEFEQLFGASVTGLGAVALAPSVAVFFAEGGGEAWIVRTPDSSDASLAGVDGGTPGTRTGLAALRDVDAVSAVVVPGATSSFVQNRMIAHCRALGDRIAILDAVPPGDVATTLAQRSALAAPDGFAALYTPWVEILYQGVPVTLPPSGFLAGVFAKTSPHRSPVDVLATATGLTQEYTASDTDLLVPEGVNPIRFFPSQGIRVWGARTLAPPPHEQLYVAARRMTNHLRESIDESTAFARSEPNDETLWTMLRAMVENYLTLKWRDGWLQGATTDDAFFVRCDRTTMTAQDIDEGRTIILVGFAPTRPAEFVIFQIVHERGDATDAPSRLEARVRLRAPSPNPFNPRTRIRFSLDRGAVVRMDVHDTAGRRVRTLLDGVPRMAGEHSVVWNGADDRGRRVASGVYTVRLRAADAVATRRVTLVE